jgi:hypothetical protein
MNRRDVCHEIEIGRQLTGVLRTAFERSPDLQAAPEFTDTLRKQLREAAARDHRSTSPSRRWFLLAAGIALAAGLTGAAVFFQRSAAQTEALARDAVGDHRNCALKFRLVRTPVPLEEAARRFDSAYRLLLSAPPDDISASGGVAHVVDRHSCSFGERRFGHVVMQYRGRLVSLLMTASETPTDTLSSAEAIPHVIGGPLDGLSVVSVSRSRHAIVLVSDLSSVELMELSRIVSLPLLQRLGGLIPGRGTTPGPIALLVAQSIQESGIVPGE